MSREMKFDIVLPFIVGMLSLGCIVAAIALHFPQWTAWLFVPGITYGSWKLTPYLYRSR